MPRSIWKGAISFGLVHIPVELHPATREQRLDLTMLDRRDFSPIGFKRYNKHTDKEVAWDDIVKAYEYADGEYVVLSDEDLRRANVEATQSIDILAFVDAAEVHQSYFDTPYYLAPGKGGAKVYALLRDTLGAAGKMGIATIVIRSKQHLAALLRVEQAIVLNTLRYHSEMRAPEELDLPASASKGASITDKELQMALALVEGMSAPWRPQQYHDTYREDILALVEQKVQAHQTKSIAMPEPEKRASAGATVVDLVALLKQSIAKKPRRGTAANDDDARGQAKPAARKEKPAAPAKRGARKAPSAGSRRG
ncbi:MAG: Ku protein [Pseudomonadota bacterium]